MRTVVCLTMLCISVLLSAHPPWGIVVDDEQNIYFADLNHNEMGSVWKLTPDGKLKLLLRNFHAHNVSLDENQHLITAHGEGDHLMLRLLPNGKHDTLVHKFHHDDFFGGNCTFSPGGSILFGIDHYIWTILPNGEKQKASDQYLEWNQALFVGKDGTIFAPDIGIEEGALYQIQADGKATIIATHLISKLDRPRDKHNDVLLGMGQDENGLVYICELAGKRIIQIDENTETNTFYVSENNWFPTAIYFHNQEVYILEYKYAKVGMEGPQIIKIDPQGQKSLIFNYEAYHNRDQSIQKSKNQGRTNWWLLGFVIFGGLFFLFIRLK